MSLFGGITNFLTGGSNSQAEQALNDAIAQYSAVQTPTAQQLSLPQLQQYVNAGLMTAAQAQAYLQQQNAYNSENVDQSGTAAMQQALGQLSGIADAGPMGTPVEQAQNAQTIQGMNNAVQGQRGAIEQQMEAKGTPAALIQAALENQNVGQDAQQAYQNSLAQQSAAYQAAVQALSEKANVGSSLQGMQNTQANTVAQAQNAMQQFNAQNQQNTSQFNAANQQAANAYNTQNAQNVANTNTQNTNARTAYNTSVPQQVFTDQMAKAAGLAGVNQSQANQYTSQGQQNAGTASGIIGALSGVGNTLSSPSTPSVGAGSSGVNEGSVAGIGPISGPANLSQYAPVALGMAKGGMVPDHSYCYHDGGICMEKGGTIPGKAPVPGNSLANDKVHIMASPGEAVIPRTAVAAHPQEVQHLIAAGRGNGPRGTMPTPGSAPAHPHDVASVLEALKQIRMGAGR